MYAKLLRWEVFNFMSIAHAVAEFDDRNIINFKGYNDSGKSAMLRALDVLMSNIRPNKQIDFIQDDKEYFRVIASFSDGVSILRDKYINGQSLYEMYKDGELIFTTKTGKALSKVPDVPQPIKDYLGLIQYDDVVMNSRSCFEKQIGVQTTGSENHKMFNTVLKSEEIASAGSMLNTDKNKLVSDINSLESELSVYRQRVNEGAGLTEELISALKSSDEKLDELELSARELGNIRNLDYACSQVVIPPEMSLIDGSQLDTLAGIVATKSALDTIHITPEVELIDQEQLTSLSQLMGYKANIDAISRTSITSEVPVVDVEQLDALVALINSASDLQSAVNRDAEIDAQLKEIDTEVEELEKQLSTMGVKMIKCPNCGKLFDEALGHVD